PLTRDNQFILAQWQGNRSRFGHFSLSGTAEDGTQFETEDLHFSSLKENWNRETGAWLNPVGRCSRATIRYKVSSPLDKPALRMYLKGFRNFGPLTGTCAIGAVAMHGQTSIADPDTITGSISVQADAAVADLPAWRSQAEELLEHVRRIMSFAAATT